MRFFVLNSLSKGIRSLLKQGMIFDDALLATKNFLMKKLNIG